MLRSKNDIGATVFREVLQAMLDRQPAPPRSTIIPAPREALALS
jgi:hypothetical protein